MKTLTLSLFEIRHWKKACAINLLCLAAVSSPAQTVTTLANFNGTDGISPSPPLALGFDGNFYGTTQYGGANCPTAGCGTVFEVTQNGALTTLDSFCSQSHFPDGSFPAVGPLQAADGNFYGTTSSKQFGMRGYGTVFKITTGGTLTTLHTFGATDGNAPEGVLVQATDGNFYGTTVEGGGDTASGPGTVFKVTSAGTFTSLYTFCSQAGCADGNRPTGALVQAADGNFYGTTGSGGGANNTCGSGGCGTIFKITPAGVLTTLHRFGHGDGRQPSSGLLLANDGNFYGTTITGGGDCKVSRYGCGTVFKIVPAGVLTTLHRFDTTDGGYPSGALIQATDGNIYGTTQVGGTNNGGTVFQITPTGTFTSLYSFCLQTACADGELPIGLMQATNGIIYGTTEKGGISGAGTVFSVATGLGPFVETNPTTGKVGWKITILGTDLTGTTSVNFNGTPAAFTVASPTKITATVPAGATTGFVSVTMPAGTLTSNVTFRLLP